MWRVRRWLCNGVFEVLAEKLPAPGRKSIPFTLNNNPCQYNVCNYGGPHTCMSCIVFWSLGEPSVHIQRKNRYPGLCEDSEVFLEGVAGQVEVAEPATGSTLMGETGRGASSTSPSGVCSSTGVKSNSSPELESSQKLPGAAL